ncbi:hypothetical protein [Chishuiella sp.]|uniref:hypothetical protein n=1 Tax=Chishuiella sp. TaxID=1969467 RepID=UPI0028A7265D|nr:hypothetical protein [Chishuiella sp.]
MIQTLEHEEALLMYNDMGAVTFSTMNDPRGEKKTEPRTKDSLEWNNSVLQLGEYYIYQYGDCNNLPTIIRDIVQKNYIAPGLLSKKKNLLWGQGPKLYREIFDGNELIREWVHDKEINHWLDFIDAETEINKLAKDYNYMEACVSKYELNKGSLIGSSLITQIDHIPINKARKGLLSKNFINGQRESTHCIISNTFADQYNHDITAKVYNLFDRKNPFASKNSIVYSNEYSFGIDVYTVPDIFGSLEWLKTSTATPLILQAFTNNSINLKFHVESPQLYWDKKELELKDICTEKGTDYKSSMLVEYRQSLFKQITTVLSGADNSGKMWHTIKLYDDNGTDLREFGWSIKPIDQNVKDFIESQIAVSQRADYAVGAGIGIHSALGNISQTGKSDSGSEQLYAHQTHLNTNVTIPEMITLKAYNEAIRANFKGTDLRLGFYHVGVKRQQDITPSERIINK